MKVRLTDLLKQGWKFNSDVRRKFEVESYQFNRDRLRIKRDDPEFYENNVFENYDRKLILSPKMIDRLKGLYIKKGLYPSKSDLRTSNSKIELNMADYETIIGFIDSKVTILEDKIDDLNEKKNNLLEFRDKVSFIKDR